VESSSRRVKFVTWSRSELRAVQKRGPRAYSEALRSPALSFGIYGLPRGAEDPQRPHAQDELYFVLSGRAELVAQGRRVTLGPGAIAFVAAKVRHRFERIGNDFVVAVAFAPPESDAPPSRRRRARNPRRRRARGSSA